VSKVQKSGNSAFGPPLRGVLSCTSCAGRKKVTFSGHQGKFLTKPLEKNGDSERKDDILPAGFAVEIVKSSYL
jgi:hypothetical protein